MSDQFERLKTALADRYAIKEELGAGGMATVYLAEDLKLNRKVAVKVLKPELAASLGTDRFLHEIQIAARLNHPHILALHDSGVADGFLYYVMPYVEGESLRDKLIREKQLAIDDALAVTKDAASALSYAHSQGVIHRDIKPANILLHEGEAMVADFGIALALSAASGERLTEAGIAVGTPEYMSPEQASGDREIDGRSDIYALACVMYEMLTGEPPFTGPTGQAVITKMFTNPVPQASVTRDTVPAAVDDALVTALAKAPADRYKTIAEFAGALGGPLTPGSSAARRGTQMKEGKSIAVLPFVNMSPNPDDEYLSDGISEELIHALSKVGGLRVVARTSAFAFKQKQVDVRIIGKQLNVDTVLEGSVRRSGTRIRVTVQLINAADGYELWSELFAGVFRSVEQLVPSLAECRLHGIGPHATIPIHQVRQQRFDAAGKLRVAFFE